MICYVVYEPGDDVDINIICVCRSKEKAISICREFEIENCDYFECEFYDE